MAMGVGGGGGGQLMNALIENTFRRRILFI